MPAVKLLKVLSYTSEDPSHPAENLLKSDSYLKWKCSSSASNAQESVTIQLAELYKISSVDVGNEGSALVEVHVARADTDFQTLLPASSLMSPIESRNGSQTNRVRMFGSDKLAKSLIDQKWDRVKVVCSQPFNKKLQFGLSFVRIQCESDEIEQASKEIKMGSFTLKEESSDEESSRPSVFGLKKKPQSDESTPSTSKASANAPEVGFYQLKKEKKDDSPDSKKDLKATVKKRSLESEDNGTVPKKIKLPDMEKIKHQKEVKVKQEKKFEKGSQNSEKKEPAKKKPKTRPFRKLMKDVTFVMSGYENPQRADLRDKLIKMGARYERDWGRSCTHLICAFSGTPKYKAVKGKGKIVTEKWIEDCYRKKIRFPCRRYNLDKNSKGSESEEEIWAEEIAEKEEKPSTSNTRSPTESMDVDPDPEEQDTDDEIERVLKKKTPQKDIKQEEKKVKKEIKEEKIDEEKETKTAENSPKLEVDTLKDKKADDIYNDDTDIEEENLRKDTTGLNLPDLPDIFDGLNFFIHQDIPTSLSESMQRYIIAYGGEISEYMSADVSHVITDSQWNDEFDEALAEHPKLEFIKSNWIKKCCDELKLVPKKSSLVVKA